MEAVRRHSDRVKFDPLVIHQIQSLDWIWTEDSSTGAIETNNTWMFDSLSSTSLYRKEGRLQISNDYFAVKIHSSCSIRGGPDCSSSHPEKQIHIQEISFQLTLTHAEFTNHPRLYPKPINSFEDQPQPSTHNVDMMKLHSDMIERLKENIHVQDLIQQLDTHDLPSNAILLCESHIQLHTSWDDASTNHTYQKQILHQDERYDVQSHILKALHIGFFSKMEGGTIDVLELLLDLPWLPRSSNIFNTTAILSSFDKDKDIPNSMPTHGWCLLGDKVTLRLLEDLLVDECANVVEEEDNHNYGDDDDVEEEEEPIGQQMKTICLKKDIEEKGEKSNPEHYSKRIRI